jgi:bifunctional UDP-N-acetylglucosamine pyrophosphorylase/glucosamine-1-phosphate N-acetyltransferase
MRSSRPKVLHPLGGLPLVTRVVRTAATLDAASLVVVVGHQADAVRRVLDDWPSLEFVVQEPQLGTGHAVRLVEPLLGSRTGTLLLLSGDVPLLSAGTLARLLQRHRDTGASTTVLTMTLDDPHGYGRIVRDEQGRIARIVEQRDASVEERRIREVNSGVYAFDLERLFRAIKGIAAANDQGEYYLPDVVAIHRREGLVVESVQVDDPLEVRGVNSQRELAELEAVVRARRVDQLMADGVTVVDPATTYVGTDVEIGPDTILHPNVHVEGRTRIGSGCEIHAGACIVDSSVDDSAVVRNYCVVQQSRIRSGAVVGPFAHIRPGSDVGRAASVGNFVELKKTVLGARSKANHLAYLGDATIGEAVNVGAGTITCNFDGEAKHRTTIEDGAFIGSDSQLVAPVTVGKGAYVAAGSSITEDVPPGSLAVARARQVNKVGWVARRKGKAGL